MGDVRAIMKFGKRGDGIIFLDSCFSDSSFPPGEGSSSSSKRSSNTSSRIVGTTSIDCSGGKMDHI